ncbi:MAG: archease [archaeon]
MKYKFLEDMTSDVVYEAYGKTLKEIFVNAAEGMFEVICQKDKIEPKDFVEVDVNADNLEDLMFSWLQELIALVDVEEMFFCKFEILEISETKLKAKVYGEPISPAKGETVVKSLTYYKYKFEKVAKRYKVTVSMDI